MAKVPNAVEILPKIWTAWVGRTNVTDRRQTDGLAIAYSSFTFAKKRNVTENFNAASAIIATPERKLLAQKHHTTHIINISIHSSLHSSPVYPAHKILCFTMLFNRPGTPKVPVAASVSLSNMVLWTRHLPQHLKLHLDWFSRFHAAHGRQLQCALKRD